MRNVHELAGFGQRTIDEHARHRSVVMEPVMRLFRYLMLVAPIALPVACSVQEGQLVDMSGGAQAVGGSTSIGGATTNTGGAPSVGGNTNAGGTSAMAGSSSTGGSTIPTGGTQALGGVTSSGGTTASGGTVTSGGAASTGGASSTGGSTSAGGSSATGGASNCPTGSRGCPCYATNICASVNGTLLTCTNAICCDATVSPPICSLAIGTGGSPATGGSSAAGGAIATSGATSTGGNPSTGGSPSTGGVSPATGGTPATGGSTSTGGVASTGGCSAGYADCDGNTTNGCEQNISTDTSNCGSCGKTCSSANGTAACSAGVCSIACSPGYANCDGSAATGCEVNTNTDANNCGSCGHVCNTTCVSGVCQTACTGYSDCVGTGKAIMSLTGTGSTTIANANTCYQWQTTSTIDGGACMTFTGANTMMLNGTTETCSGNWATIPAKVNGGYCFHGYNSLGAGASFDTW